MLFMTKTTISWNNQCKATLMTYHRERCRLHDTNEKGWRKSIFIRWNGILAPFIEAQHRDLEGGHWHRTFHQLKVKKKSSIQCGTGVSRRGHEQKQQSKQTKEKKTLTFWHRVPFHEDLCYRVAHSLSEQQCQETTQGLCMWLLRDSFWHKLFNNKESEGRRCFRSTEARIAPERLQSSVWFVFSLYTLKLKGGVEKQARL